MIRTRPTRVNENLTYFYPVVDKIQLHQTFSYHRNAVVVFQPDLRLVNGDSAKLFFKDMKKIFPDLTLLQLSPKASFDPDLVTWCNGVLLYKGGNLLGETVLKIMRNTRVNHTTRDVMLRHLDEIVGDRSR
ncbi:TPA: hypothetical protein DCQ44_00690 [Candidatus Taylorbacteria bacterium]|nr:hypothetical protein [Candidatus Taylorbacteria bacterium]